MRSTEGRSLLLQGVHEPAGDARGVGNGGAHDDGERAGIAREDADTALQATLLQRCEVYIGTYVGLSEENNLGTVNVPQTITLGFRPKAVLIFTQSGETSTGNGYVRGGLCMDGYPIGGSSNGAYITDTGFVAESPSKYLKLNGLGMTYYYIAFKQA